MASGQGHLSSDYRNSSFRLLSAAGATRQNELSPWSRSAAKRLFDCACVLLALPVALPALLAIAAAVRLTSPGPVLFRQKRIGRHGRAFTIVKFRTIVDGAGEAEASMASWSRQRLTPVGAFLRNSKLDELPQLVNVLLGHMSLVGPRPKPLEEMICSLACRPGITGMATLAFAHEEALFTRVPRDRFSAYFHGVVLPVKQQLDAAYMARATFFSDLGLLTKSVFGRWDTASAEKFIAAAAFDPDSKKNSTLIASSPAGVAPASNSFGSDETEAAEQVPAL